ATGRPLTPDTLEPATLASYQYGTKVSAADYLRALDLRNTVTRAIGAWFDELDVLLTPTLPGMPLHLGIYQQGAERLDGLGWTERVLGHSPFSALFNMAGTPAMSMPLCTDADSGLPVGLQFAAGFGREDVLFRLAGQLEQSMPWVDRKPPVWAGTVAVSMPNKSAEPGRNSAGQEYRADKTTANHPADAANRAP